MGLDIVIATDNYDELYSGERTKEHSYFIENSLSRTFCDLMSRQHDVSHEPELDQIGEITGVDISPIYELEYYPEEETVQFHLDNAESESEKQKILQEAEGQRAKLAGNLDKVLMTVTDLINKLNSIDNLPEHLLPDADLLNNQVYFADFKIDKGKGYIGNNFGQDLRNFRRFLEFAKSTGAKTVWFQYG
jgi:hypothetical protein